MRKILLLFTFVLFTPPMFGQENEAITERLGAKYGFACYHESHGGWYSIRKGGYDAKGREGACDIKGREVIPPIWDDVSFHGTYYEVKKNDFVGIRDLNNRELLPCNKYSAVRWYQKSEYGGYCEVAINGKYGIINSSNMEIVPCRYDETYFFELKKQPFCIVIQSGRKGVYNVQNNKETIPCLYDDITLDAINGFCVVKQNGKVGVLNLDNEELLPCNKYTEVRWYQKKDYGGYCEVEIEGKHGVIDKDNKEVIPCQYDNTSPFQLKDAPFCYVEKNGEKGLYDIGNKKEVIPCGKYGYMIMNHWAKVALVECDAKIVPAHRENGQYIAQGYGKHGLWGVVDLTTGNEFIPCKYHYLALAGGGLFTFNVGGTLQRSTGVKPEGGKWGCIDDTGNVVVAAEYDNPIAFRDGVAQVCKNGITSLLPHPKLNYDVANSSTNSYVDMNIPITNKSNENTFAFIISNENYAHYKGADFSSHDGKTFAEYCKKTLGIPEINIRRYEDATYGNMVSAMSKLKDIAEVYEGDATIILYYSGLGMQNSRTHEPYLVPVDATEQSLDITGYKVRQLIEELGELETKLTLVILDAPFSGADKNGKVLTNDRSVMIAPKPIETKGNSMIIVKSDSNAFASPQHSHGLLTNSILKTMKDTKGMSNIADMMNEASAWVKKESLSSFKEVQTIQVITPVSNPQILKYKF